MSSVRGIGTDTAGAAVGKAGGGAFLWNGGIPDGADQQDLSFWRSLVLFNAYRLAIALILLVVAASWREHVQFGSRDPGLFLGAAAVYALFSTVCFALIRTRRHFDLQVSLQVGGDVLFIVVLTYASGGISSGLGLLMLTSLAAAGLISRGRLALFHAALASIGALLEHTYEVLVFDAAFAQYAQAGLLSCAYFAVALVAHELAKYTRASEELAAQREIDLQDLAEVNQHVIQDMQDGVLVVDGEGTIRQFNARAEQLLGVLRGRRGTPLDNYCPPLAARFSEWCSSGDAADAQGEIALGRNLSARFVPVSRRRAAGALIFIEDLTRLQKQARQMKLAALGRLTANLAHEIRNPLGAISHAAELLQEEQPGSDSAGRLLTIIRDNSQRLDRMVNEVLWLNRGDRAQRENVDVAEHLREFVEQFSEVEKIDVAVFRIDVADDVAILFDKTHLDQVMWNLCCNAVRHSTQSAGSVRIRVTADVPHGAVQLDVIDDGPGVPAALRTRLFEPFFTTAPGGTGLGLYIAREVCEANGATLEYVERRTGAQFALVCRAG
jgi:two-component system, NtrC family, sensor histidine kinase PilS